MGITAENQALKVKTSEFLEARKETIFKALELAWLQLLLEAGNHELKPKGFVAEITIKLEGGDNLVVKPEGVFVDSAAEPVVGANVVAIEAATGGSATAAG